MAESGFARLKPKGGARGPKGTPEHAPTPSDQAQSDVHHTDSVLYNLAHAGAHVQEAQKHAAKISQTLRTLPATAAHAQALDTMPGGVGGGHISPSVGGIS